MSKQVVIVVAVAALVLLAVTPAAAITGGQPDGGDHPYGALLLVPGYTFCSGTLIDEDVVLTAGHCTSFWTGEGIAEVQVTFDAEAGVDPATWQIVGGTWYTARAWATYPTYDDAAWPFTRDYGLVFLDAPVSGIAPAALPEAGVLGEMIGDTGQTGWRFMDVGYGQDGVNVGGGPPTRNFSFVRKVSVQRYNPSQGAVGALDPSWFILGNVPADDKGGGCGGDSGSGIFPAADDAFGDTVLAVHTGGYRLGYLGRICGRITSLNHRVDLPDVLAWIAPYVAD